MNKDTLHEVVLQIQQMEIDIQGYAGKAFLDNDEKQMKYFRGFYNGLEMLRKDLDGKYLGLLVEEEKEKEKTFALHVKYQTAALLPHDHALFDDIVNGLVCNSWEPGGGSPTFRLLHKQDVAIKIFRDEEAPAVIRICFSVEPEGVVRGGESVTEE